MFPRLPHGVVFAALAALPILTVAAQELPTTSDPKAVLKEAEALIDGLPLLKDKAPPPSDAALLPGPAVGTIEQEQKRLIIARQKQERWERLAKQGVLSRAEAEQCALEVCGASMRCEKARLAKTKQELEVAKQRVAGGEQDASVLHAAEAAVKASEELAANAETQWNQTRLALAQVNLDRHRKLYAEHLVTKAAVERAESVYLRVQAQAGGAPQ